MSKNFTSLRKFLFTSLSGLVFGIFLPLAYAAQDDEDRRVAPPIVPSPIMEVTPEDEISCVGRRHVHKHFNTSVNSGGNEYWGAVYSFAIVFEDDFLENAETEELLCTDGLSIYKDCGFDKEDDLGEVVFEGEAWNGTRITYKRLDWIAGGPLGLLWEYGTDDIEDVDLKPWLPAGEFKQEAISQVRPVLQEGRFTATTNSWTKMQFWHKNPRGAWNEIYTDQVKDFGKERVDSDGDFIYWYGLNGRTRSIFDDCEEPPEPPEEDAPICHHLGISPSNRNIGVDDLYVPNEFTATAYDERGIDITGNFNYKWTGTNDRGGLADAVFEAAGATPANPFKSPLSRVTYNFPRPANKVSVQAFDKETDEGIAECIAEVEFPWCEDLSLDSPSTPVTNENPVDVEVTATANTGEEWPFELKFSSSDPNGLFTNNADESSNPLVSKRNNAVYETTSSSGAHSVEVKADYQGKNFCLASFVHEQDLFCESLRIDEDRGPITLEEMREGNIEISFEAIYSDGAASVGPFEITARDTTGALARGTFTLSAGAAGGSNPINTAATTVFYSGGLPGDTIEVRELGEPAAACIDNLISETPEPDAPICEDLYISDGPLEEDGTPINILETETLFAQDTVCFEFEIDLESSDFGGLLVAEGWSDSRQSALNGTLSLELSSGAEAAGNPIRLPLDDELESYTGTVCWENFEEGNDLELYIADEQEFCSDDFIFPTEEPEAPFCVDLELSPNTFTLDEDEVESGVFDLDLTIQGSSSDFRGTLVIESEGSCELSYFDGSDAESDGTLRIPVSGISDTVSALCDEARAEDTIRAFIEGETPTCEDTFRINSNVAPEEEICRDLEVEIPDSTEGETIDVIFDIDSDVDNQTLVIEYENCPGEIEYDGDSFEDVLEIDNLDGDERVEVAFTEICEDAEINAFIEGHEDLCSVEETPEILALGEFEKYIYTFNFSAEKNATVDENIFWAHDEDRAFYTLEYNPSGSEDNIIFEDEMWTGDLDGWLGGEVGGQSGGQIHLATSKEELTSGSAYNYSTIVNFGFGNAHELNSNALADYVQAQFDADRYQSFVPYLQYQNGDESSAIASCDDAPSSLCYNPNESPERTGRVEIENVDRTPENALIRVRYVGVIASGLDCANQADACLTEEFKNTATVQVYDGVPELEAEATLVVLCPYLVTRNAGDVYLEVQLKGGSDISCIFVDKDDLNSSEYRNTDSLIILEANEFPERTLSEYRSDYSNVSVSVCDDSTFDQDLIGNLSSYVCEIVNAVSDIWRTPAQISATESEVSRAIRNAQTSQNSQTARFDNWSEMENSLKNQNNPSSGILYFDGNLSESKKLSIGNMTVPNGAWTLIVENAELEIFGNIEYAPSTDINQIPSIAFIVLGGDVFIKNSAFELVGVYYTDQNFDGDERSPVNEPLTVYGSLYGNLQALLDAAQYVGPPSLDDGSITVYYDSRILLNTPPALSEYVDINTRQAVN